MTEVKQDLPCNSLGKWTDPRPLFAFSKLQFGLTEQVINGLAHSMRSVSATPVKTEKHSPEPGGYLACLIFRQMEMCYFSLNNGDSIELQAVDTAPLTMLMPAHRSQKSPVIERAIGQRITWLGSGDSVSLCGAAHQDYLLVSLHDLPSVSDEHRSLLNESYFEHNLSRYCLMMLIQSLYQPTYKTAINRASDFERQLTAFIASQLGGEKVSFSGHIPTHVIPQGVEIAEAHMLGNPTWEYDIHTLAKLTQQSARTLYYQFQRHRSMTPYRFHSMLKLYRVRTLLNSDTEPNESIAYHATSCGFYHLGRFSALYNSVFGELPRKTRERRQKLNLESTSLACVDENRTQRL